MNDRTKKLEAIFHAASELTSPEERESFLNEVCLSDAALRKEVEDLLNAAVIGEERFRPVEQASARFSHLPSEPVTERAGAMIGRYKLLEKIGEGGMGVVYMAEQREPVLRKVALKIIKAGMDTRQVIARFEAERQALALTDHPNIAKVLDGGETETGRPYFVMDLVQGLPITQFCDEAKLSTRERLELFLDVCSAIQHAHQKGIIHRDIKPSNILVTLHGDKPVPKVIDFGIAKATQQPLTDKTLFTQFQHFLGTPAYISPEQASLSGLDIDTRSDIYALGVLLYELLTGTTPFDGKELLKSGLDEMRRTIREKEPARPSTRLSTMLESERTTTAQRRSADAPKLISILLGDLDWIVVKCLEKDRSRRYETSNALALDLQRYLNNEGVMARPPSAAYRLQKLVRRNKVAFAATAAVIAALLVGVAVSTWLYFREKTARQRAVAAETQAETQAARSTQVARFMQDMLAGVGPSKARGRDTTMLREILDKTSERIGKGLTNQPEVEIELRTILAETYRDLGLFREGETMARQAVELAQARYGEEHLATARARIALGWVLFGLGQGSPPEALLRQGLAVQKHLSPPDSPDVAETLDKLAQVLRYRTKLSEAELVQREAIAMTKKLFGSEHPTLPRSLNNLGLISSKRSHTAEAEVRFREALDLSERLLGKDDPEGAIALEHLGRLLKDRGFLIEAEGLFRDALARQTKILGEEHPALTDTLRDLASALKSQNKVVEAEAFYRRAIAIRRKAFGDAGDGVEPLISALASLFESQTNVAGLTEITEMYRHAGEQGDPEAYFQLAQMYARGRGVPMDDVQSAKFYLKMMELFRRRVEAGGTGTGYAAKRLGDMYQEGWGVTANFVEAAKWFSRAAELGNVEAQSNLGRIYSKGRGVAKDAVAAVKWYRQAAEAGVLDAQNNLGILYLRGDGVQKDSVEAVKWFRLAAEAGEANAQRALATCYTRGEGVAKDARGAARWAHLAAEQFLKGAESGGTGAVNDLAWLLATADSPEIRDGRRAVELAQKAVTATSRTNATFLDTLAAAYAETGQFEKAITIQMEALSSLNEKELKELKDDFSSRLKLYQSHTPYRGD